MGSGGFGWCGRCQKDAEESSCEEGHPETLQPAASILADGGGREGPRRGTARRNTRFTVTSQSSIPAGPPSLASTTSLPPERLNQSRHVGTILVPSRLVGCLVVLVGTGVTSLVQSVPLCTLILVGCSGHESVCERRPLGLSDLVDL